MQKKKKKKRKEKRKKKKNQTKKKKKKKRKEKRKKKEENIYEKLLLFRNYTDFFIFLKDNFSSKELIRTIMGGKSKTLLFLFAS